jgi:hypothetical protein
MVATGFHGLRYTLENPLAVVLNHGGSPVHDAPGPGHRHPSQLGQYLMTQADTQDWNPAPFGQKGFQKGPA